MSDIVLKSSQALAELPEAGLSVQRLDFLHDQLKLMGAVIGLKRLLETAAFSTDDKAAVSASRILVQIDEDPEVIATRLKQAAFADFTTDELEELISRTNSGEALEVVIEDIKDKRDAD